MPWLPFLLRLGDYPGFAHKDLILAVVIFCALVLAATYRWFKDHNGW